MTRRERTLERAAVTSSVRPSAKYSFSGSVLCGKVYLLDHIAGPRVRCTLDVIGTGMNAEGNPTFDYTGECVFRGR